MKYTTTIKTVSGGRVINLAQGEPIELTEEEYEDNLHTLKQVVNDSKYIELNGKVIPGEFLKTRCFVCIEKDEN